MDLEIDWISATEAQLRNATLSMDQEKAIVAMYELSAENPCAALEVIVNVVAKQPNEKVLACLGAGPLEELLIKHPEYITKVTEVALSNPSFRGCLENVSFREGLDDKNGDCGHVKVN